MRLHRLLVAASSLVLLPLTAAGAQQARLFDNAWFWGVHGGATEIGTPATATQAQATIGGEWLITRTTGGLYVSYDQTMFNRTSAVTDASAIGGLRRVSIHDMRTGSIAGMVFPWHSGGFRPYAGLGAQLAVLGSATAQTDANGAPSSDVDQRVEDARSRTAVFLMGGAQWQVRRAAVFGQVTMTPSDSQFLVSHATTSITAGVRYNFGSSIGD